MNATFESVVLRATGADALLACEPVQSLWSGYGDIVRCRLRRGSAASVVVKHVRAPTVERHPRGWNTSRSHARKLTSYQVETAWYEHWAARCDVACRVPHCLLTQSMDAEAFIVLEDLDESGFAQRRETASIAEVTACLRWLANFHATFMSETPTHLWPTGTYWHLATRPDELEKMDHAQLKNAAPHIDRALNASPFQTFVHGDAKLANFCFAADGTVAAVDFQYVGGGCGMKDVAYLISSCLNEAQCEQHEALLLETYFRALQDALAERNKRLDFAQLEANWRDLYPFAWSDFLRFLLGWSPGHWKIHAYSQRLAQEVLSQL